MLDRLNAKKMSLLALALLVLYPIAIAGARLDIWHFRNSFLIFVLVSLVGFALLVLSILKMAKSGAPASAEQEAASTDSKWLVLTILATGLPLAMMGNNIIKAQSHPFIHDISTDLTNPPAFIAAAQVRTEADHGVSYDKANAELQQAGYPELSPLVLNKDAKTALHTAKVLMQKMGWQILSVQDQALPYTLEASESSLLFGFVDDVALRFEVQQEGQTLIHMRSQSRQGQSDLGVNAKRIKDFFAELATQ